MRRKKNEPSESALALVHTSVSLECFFFINSGVDAVIEVNEVEICMQHRFVCL